MDTGKEKTLGMLKSMTADELRDLRAAIDTELKKREIKERQEATRKILEIANAHGINIAELASKGRQYRNPNNQWDVWSGRGRKPKWVVEWLASGKTLEELEVS